MRALLKDKLLKQYGYCQACGIKNVPLALHHIIPLSAGGTNDENNFVLLCSNCNHAIVNRLFSEYEFNSYLADLLTRSPDFDDIKREVFLSREKRVVVDITARTRDGKTLLIECKSDSSFTPARMHQAVSQIMSYKTLTNSDKYVLAFPGLISSSQAASLTSLGIEVWDARTIAAKFKSEIAAVPHSIFNMLLASITPSKSKALEDNFIAKLKECKKGKESWVEYQKLVGQILEHLFCPPLETPISESADHESINRRDWIIPNYADQGFWNFIREKYRADYIVVDAKNCKTLISKSQVLQIANYLKMHGAGMFAMIITRLGADKGAHSTIREQWMANKKMILILNDEDVEAMLLAKLANGNPEKIIGQTIERFRLSM